MKNSPTKTVASLASAGYLELLPYQVDTSDSPHGLVLRQKPSKCSFRQSHDMPSVWSQISPSLGRSKHTPRSFVLLPGTNRI